MVGALVDDFVRSSIRISEPTEAHELEGVAARRANAPADHIERIGHGWRAPFVRETRILKEGNGRSDEGGPRDGEEATKKRAGSLLWLTETAS
jgi:hypothetical protein